MLEAALFQGIVVGHDYAKATFGIGSGFRSRIANLRRKGLPIRHNKLSIRNPFTNRISRPYEYFIAPEDILRMKESAPAGQPAASQ